MQFHNLIVQKFGGATLADPIKIKHAAERVARLSKNHPLIVVVSAMGKTTDSLIELAHQVSALPQRREMDMLLSVGERISMSLLSMALNDLGCPAISFTGSQAGIMTDDSHINAFIQDVRPIRVAEALQQNKIVILAGFQGVSPVSKEITTLGRGGSDTTAMAMAAHFGALRCDILKDVLSIFSADPNRVPTARPLRRLSYQNLSDMTFWGAKVLHYRSSELALLNKIPLYIGPAADDQIDFSRGTLVGEENSMFYEGVQFLSVNFYENVCVLEIENTNWQKALSILKEFLNSKQLPLLQVLQIQKKNSGYEIWLTGPPELVKSVQSELKSAPSIKIENEFLSTVTMTCTGSASGAPFDKISEALKEQNVPIRSVLCQGHNLTLLIPQSYKDISIKRLHSLIEAQP